MKCNIAQEKIVGLLTGETPQSHDEELLAHLGTCDACREEAAQLRETWDMLGKLPTSVPDGAASERFATRVAGLRLGAPSHAGRMRLVMTAAVLAASLLIGVTIGRWSNASPGVVPTDDTQSQFLLLLHESVSPQPGLPSVAELVGEYSAWANRLNDAALLVTAKKLTADAGVWLRPGEELGGEQTISGFFLIRADDYDDAMMTAQQSPHLKYGGSIEIRAIDDER